MHTLINMNLQMVHLPKYIIVTVTLAAQVVAESLYKDNCWLDYKLGDSGTVYGEPIQVEGEKSYYLVRGELILGFVDRLASDKVYRLAGFGSFVKFPGNGTLEILYSPPGMTDWAQADEKGTPPPNAVVVDSGYVDAYDYDQGVIPIYLCRPKLDSDSQGRGDPGYTLGNGKECSARHGNGIADPENKVDSFGKYAFLVNPKIKSLEGEPKEIPQCHQTV